LKCIFFKGEIPMRRQFLLASVGALALTGSAVAADLPYRGPPPVYLPPVPIFTWSGLYMGLQVGYAWARDDTDFTTLDPAAPFFSADTRPQGVIGGGHVGYNLQIAQWVVGLEGTVDGTSLNKTVVLTGIPVLSVGSRETVQGSIRARLGVAFDRVLLYGTGGAAFAGITNAYSIGFPFFLSETISKTRAGWTAGGGIEYAVTNNWSIRAEYRYSDFGRYTDFPFVSLASAPQARHHVTENQVQAGISYKFTPFGPGPVVAKY
jgi:outer membrane immunogenic protein